MIIGECLDNVVDAIPPYGNILYHSVWTKYVMNLGYSTVASIIFYYFIEYHRFKKNKYQYHRMISSLTEVMTTIINSIATYSTNNELVEQIKSIFPDSRLKVNHLNTSVDLSNLVNCIQLGQRTILSKEINSEVEIEILKMREISRKLSKSMFFKDLKNIHENMNFISVDMDVSLEYFITSFEEILEWNDLDDALLAEFAKKLNINMAILTLNGMDILIELKHIIKHDIQYVLKQ